jgi:hypothetical protein
MVSPGSAPLSEEDARIEGEMLELLSRCDAPAPPPARGTKRSGTIFERRRIDRGELMDAMSIEDAEARQAALHEMYRRRFRADTAVLNARRLKQWRATLAVKEARNRPQESETRIGIAKYIAAVELAVVLETLE